MMIGWGDKAQDLEEQICSRRGNWFGRAQRFTAENRAAGTLVRKTGIWSEIKDLYMQIQEAKCGYCERRLGSGAIEWDVEHFRPKGRVDQWRATLGGTMMEDGGGEGYFLLTYAPRNYLASCKVCNSSYKRNYFPVAGRHKFRTDDFAVLSDERPYLLNPLDPADVDPESVIGFHGPVPQPKSVENSLLRDRALVTIEVLALARPDLIFERSHHIVGLEVAIRAYEDSGDAKLLEWIDRLCRRDSPHSSCCRAFRSLRESDPAVAEGVFEKAFNLAVGVS